MQRPLWIQVAHIECSPFSRYAGRKSATRATRHRVGRAEHNPSLSTPRSKPLVQRLMCWTLWHQPWPRAAMGCLHSSRGGTVILACTSARHVYVLTSDECLIRAAASVAAIHWLTAAAPVRLAGCGAIMMTRSVPVMLPAPVPRAPHQPPSRRARRAARQQQPWRSASRGLLCCGAGETLAAYKQLPP